jgi:hypothetical protein
MQACSSENLFANRVGFADPYLSHSHGTLFRYWNATRVAGSGKVPEDDDKMDADELSAALCPRGYFGWFAMPASGGFSHLF